MLHRHDKEARMRGLRAIKNLHAGNTPMKSRLPTRTRIHFIRLVWLAVCCSPLIVGLCGAEIDHQQTILNARLIAAIIDHDNRLISRLLHEGADVNARDWTPVRDSSLWTRIRAVFRRSLHPILPPTALMRAIETRDPETVTILVNRGANLEARAESPEQTAVMWAAEANAEANDTGDPHALEILKLILDRGAMVNARDKDGTTALMEAVVARSHEAIKLLLAYGADPAPKDKFHKTALDWANELCEDCIAPLTMRPKAQPRGGVTTARERAIRSRIPKTTTRTD
jgi:hypothetical protein